MRARARARGKYNEYLMSEEKAASAPEGRCVPTIWVVGPVGERWKSRIHHRSIRNPSRGQGEGARGRGWRARESGEEEAINFTARFIMEPPSIIAAGYAGARRSNSGAIINSEKLLIAIMSSFTEPAAAAAAVVSSGDDDEARDVRTGATIRRGEVR